MSRLALLVLAAAALGALHCSDDGPNRAAGGAGAGGGGAGGAGAGIPVPCSTGQSCSDGDPCTLDLCDDGSCTSAPSCSGHGTCDSSAPPACGCDVGYAGDYCDSCADTHVMRGDGLCVASPDPDRYLLASVLFDEQGQSLAALDPDTAELFPLSALSRDVRAMAFDPQTETLYGVAVDHPAALVTIDVATGSTETVKSLTYFHVVSGLTFDEDERALRSHGQIGAAHYDVVYYVDSGVLGTGDYSSVDTYDELGMAWDSATGETMAIGQQHQYRLDAINYTTAEQLFWLDALGRGVDRPGLTFGPAGGSYFVGNRKLVEPEWAEAYCRAVSSTLGAAVDDLPVVSSYGSPIAAGAAQILSEPAGPALFAHASYGNETAPIGELRIATSEPTDVVCLVTYEEPLHVTVAADAQFQLLVLASFDPSFTITIESGFEPGSLLSPPIHHAVTTGDAPESPDPSLVAVYGHAEWYALDLAAAVYDADFTHFPLFGTLDWSTGTITTSELAGVNVLGGITKLR